MMLHHSTTTTTSSTHRVAAALSYSRAATSPSSLWIWTICVWWIMSPFAPVPAVVLVVRGETTVTAAVLDVISNRRTSTECSYTGEDCACDQAIVRGDSCDITSSSDATCRNTCEDKFAACTDVCSDTFDTCGARCVDLGSFECVCDCAGTSLDCIVSCTQVYNTCTCGCDSSSTSTSTTDDDDTSPSSSSSTTSGARSVYSTTTTGSTIHDDVSMRTTVMVQSFVSVVVILCMVFGTTF